MKTHHLYSITGGSLLLLVGIWLSSCQEEASLRNDETVLAQSSSTICFGISDKGAWAETRAAGTSEEMEAKDVDRFVLRSENSSDTLCVTTSVGDWGKTATRATLAEQMYDAFGVFAYIYSGAEKTPNYYMYNENITKKNDGLWGTSGNTYYWPGADHVLRFCAYAPYDCRGVTLPDREKPEMAPVLAYTVPAEVDQQEDLLVAVSGEMQGDAREVVPLTFEHICTAVEFVEGEDMPPGTIQKISVKGVYNRASYDLYDRVWKDYGTTADFSQTVGEGAESAATTFVMIPQQLPEDAVVEVEFLDALTSTLRTLTATIAGSEWPAGKRVKYRLSITPTYELRFEEEPKEQDAHYVIYPIKVKADQALTKGWTLSSSESWVTLRTDLTDLEKQGYWIEEDRGEQEITSTLTDEVTVYAFLEENIGDATRAATLSLRPAAYPNATPEIFTISQLSPAWNGNGLGCERIEENNGGPYPWGFDWNRKVTYRSNIPILRLIYRLIAENYIDQYGTGDYVTASGGFFSPVEITIDYNKLSTLDGEGQDKMNGLKNTQELFTFKGAGVISQMENLFDNWYISKQTINSNTQVENFAVRMAVLKNKFRKEIKTQTDGGQTITYEVPVINNEDIVWYLPAADEYGQMKDQTYPLSGDYWTSTAFTDNTQAYKAINGVVTSVAGRMEEYKIRCARRRP